VLPRLCAKRQEPTSHKWLTPIADRQGGWPVNLTKAVQPESLPRPIW